MTRHEVPVAATGVLRHFAAAAMIAPADFHMARRMGAMRGEDRDDVLLAFALATRELRLGSVCLDLREAHLLAPETELDDGSATRTTDLEWPDVEAWLDAVASSPAVAGPSDDHQPFRLDQTLLYLDRFWCEEQQVARALASRSALPGRPLPDHAVEAALVEVDGHGPDEAQQRAVRHALAHATTVITGGPGTGKTTTVARILRGLAASDQVATHTVALAAPTGKAAARLQQAVHEQLGALAHSGGLRLTSTTLHKLLGVVPGRAQNTYHSGNPLPHDVVVVDETSMVSLSMMATLLDAVAPSTRLVLVGDPHQLTSVEAGAVLADVAAAPHLVTSQDGTPAVVALRRNWRSNTEINELSDAVLTGDVARALTLLEQGRDCTLTPFTGTETLGSFRRLTDSLRGCAAAVVDAAARGDGVGANSALGLHRVLCAHREGPFGVGRWSDLVRSFLAGQLPGYGDGAAHWVGQPLLITRNNGTLSNGDTAVVVREGSRLVAAVEQASGELRVDPTVLDGAADLHAMTIHKSQGSQFDAVSVVIPPVGSPLLTRELLYTAITRARSSVRLYGSAEALAEAIATPSHRSSGLRRPPEDQA